MNKTPVEPRQHGAVAPMSSEMPALVKPGLPDSPPPRLLDRLRHAIRVRHFAIRTEQTYVDWARRFILFHGKRHPQDMGVAEVEAHLTHLAFVCGVAAPSTYRATRSRLCVHGAARLLAFAPARLARSAAATVFRSIARIATHPCPRHRRCTASPMCRPLRR